MYGDSLIQPMDPEPYNLPFTKGGEGKLNPLIFCNTSHRPKRYKIRIGMGSSVNPPQVLKMDVMLKKSTISLGILTLQGRFSFLPHIRLK